MEKLAIVSVTVLRLLGYVEAPAIGCLELLQSECQGRKDTDKLKQKQKQGYRSTDKEVEAQIQKN